MSYIIVCPLSRLNEMADYHQVSHVLTLINNDAKVETPKKIKPENHLFLGMNDIVISQQGLDLPIESQVQMILDFAKNWNQLNPLLVHCYAGVSRSTAAAYMITLLLNPDLDPFDLAQNLRKLSPFATPNLRLISLADEIMGYNGKMVAAISGIGRGADCFENIPFTLEISTFRPKN
jgi:predicted protein tyrosine phosphatase